MERCSGSTMLFRTDDLIIFIAYFSIPIQIAVSLYRYPRLSNMPPKILILVILFALFIFLCGTGHLMRFLGNTSSFVFDMLNGATAFVSLTTALYLLPLIPTVMETIDQGLVDLSLKAELEETKRKLITFMSFLCHEVRNPLFAITSTVSLLEEDEEGITSNQKRALRFIDESARLMLRLANDVLELGKLESGELVLVEGCFEFKELVQNVAASTASLMERKGKHNDVQFVFEMNDCIPTVACGDSARLLQIVYNLLSNATKFTEKGHIGFKVSTMSIDVAHEAYLRNTSETSDIDGERSFSFKIGQLKLPTKASTEPMYHDHSTSLLAAAESGDAPQAVDRTYETSILHISVSDTGPGIPKSCIDHMFEPYSEAKLSHFRKQGGTGLGLTIITKLVKIMGGSISVRSEIGVGSTIDVYLPISVPMEESMLLQRNHLVVLDDFSESRFPEFIKAGDDRKDYCSTSSHRNMALVVDEPLIDDNNGSVLTTSETTFDITRSRNATTKALTFSKFNFHKNENVVLVVDDNPVNVKLITKMLDKFNLQYEAASNGQEAVDKILLSSNVSNDPNGLSYGLIIMDIQMPILDGCDATRILRQCHNVKIPIVALTANALDQYRSMSLDAGANEFATKPITMKELHTKCCEYLLRDADNIV